MSVACNALPEPTELALKPRRDAEPASWPLGRLTGVSSSIPCTHGKLSPRQERGDETGVTKLILAGDDQRALAE